MKPATLAFSRLVPFLLGSGLLLAYFLTLAPGLTWANGGSDGGDLIAAVATNGIPHPTGYPTYLLLAELCESLPFSTLAYRLNLLSAVASTAAAMIVYWTVANSSGRPAGQQGTRLAGLIAGLAYGFAPMVWGQAVITEVYALHGFLAALILFLYSYEFPSVSRNMLAALKGLILGLAIGNHVTTVLMVPAFLIGSGIHETAEGSPGSWRFDWKSILWQLTFLLLGMLVYLMLPLRASVQPAMNWGNPVTVDRLWWLISGQLYQQNLLVQPIAMVWSRLQALASLSLQQFGLVGVFAAVVGLVVFYSPNRLNFFCMLQVFLHAAFAVVYSTSDSYLYLLPVWLAFAIWIGRGVIGAQDWLGSRRTKVSRALGMLLLAYVLIFAASNERAVNASMDLRAESFGRQVMASAPAQAIIFAQGDRAVFTLWYFHFALEERPDLIVIAQDLLHFDWYQEVLNYTYPSLALPEPFPWSATITTANPQRPVCRVEYREQATIECSQP